MEFHYYYLQSLSVELPEMEGMSDGPSPSPSSDMDVYESQLNQLQEHLVAAMLENQQLSKLASEKVVSVNKMYVRIFPLSFPI